MTRLLTVLTGWVSGVVAGCSLLALTLALITGQLLPLTPQLAYTAAGDRQTEVVLLDLDRQMQLNLTTADPAAASIPSRLYQSDDNLSWSPTGDALVYLAHENTRQASTLMQLDLRGVRTFLPVQASRIAELRWSVTDAAWLPTVATLLAAYPSTVASARPYRDAAASLLVMRPDARLPVPEFLPQPVDLSEADAALLSPDGTWLAVRVDGVIYLLPESPAPELRTSPLRLWQISPPDSHTLEFAWSPDSTRLALLVRRDPPSAVGELLVFDRTAGTLVNVGLAAGNHLVHSVQWSPDGSRIILVNDAPEEPTQLLLLDLAAGQWQTLAGDQFERIVQPGWSPDGAYLVFIGYRRWQASGEPGGLYLLPMPAAGGSPTAAPHPLTTLRAQVWSPRWRPSP